MEIDKSGTGVDESIVLFPRSYNKRGDERLHSVQGVTLDGREVNIKLRVDESMQGKENTPSIAEFSREDVKCKNPCVASVENAPGNREGVLLFTGCEEDGENKKGIQSYTARWAYVLASHSDSPEPVFGLGRVVMIAESVAAKSIHQELTELERTKVEGWEAIAERKRKALNDPMLFSYYGQLYQSDEEKTFETQHRQAIIDFANDTFLKYTKHGVVGGLLIRTLDDDNAHIGGFSSEIFPRWKRNNTYQTADDVLGFFFQANAARLRKENSVSLMLMPIMRYSCGPSFKNYYFLKKPDESLLKLRRRFLINNEPTVCQIAFALSRREESGESFMMKYYPLSHPLSSVADIGKVQEARKAENLYPGSQGLNHQLRPPVGLSSYPELFFPLWHRPELMSPALTSREPTDALDVPEEPQQCDVQAPTTADNPEVNQANVLPVKFSEEVPAHQLEAANNVPVEEGDLSDIFSEFSEEELDTIAEAERIALEASLILQSQEQEAAEADEAEEAHAPTEEQTSADVILEPKKGPEDLALTPAVQLNQSDLCFTDLSTDSVALALEIAVTTPDESATTSGQAQEAETGTSEKDIQETGANNGMSAWLKNRGLL